MVYNETSFGMVAIKMYKKRFPQKWKINKYSKQRNLQELNGSRVVHILLIY